MTRADLSRDEYSESLNVLMQSGAEETHNTEACADKALIDVG